MSSAFTFLLLTSELPFEYCTNSSSPTSVMGADMISRGSCRSHHGGHEHNTSSFHDDDAHFDHDLHYGDSSPNSESDDCSGDDKSPIGNQLVDNTNLEAQHQHWVDGRGTCRTSVTEVATAAGTEVLVGAIPLPCTGGRHLL